MSRLDIIVFGATGFTGKYVVEKLLSLCGKSPYTDLTWGVAGRSKAKLEGLLKEISDTGVPTSDIPITIADVADEDSLRAMSKSAKVIMNCTGPYTVLGEPVVRACIDTRTHYVDMTAELHFMLEMYEKHDKAAQEANVLVITAAGFGSVPAAMGMVQLEKEFKGTLASVECYTELHIPKRAYLPGCDNTLVHYGTWASLVYELQNFRRYQENKKRVFPEELFDSEPKETKRGFFHRSNGKFWFPYPGPDHDIIEMTERHLKKTRNKPPVRFESYTTMPWLFHLIVLIPAFMFYYYASYMRCFRKLLWKFPRFFTLGYISHKGPSKRNMEELKFSFLLNGKGAEVIGNDKKIEEKDKTMTVKVSGIDPYAITALVFAMSAITVVKEEAKIPSGGVLSTGAAFYDTSLVDRLNSNGLVFETFE